MMETEETRQWERHVTANNQRLITITQSLSSDPNSFEISCRELLQWCNDPRAFTVHFESNLLNALQAVVDNGNKEAYQMDLAAELVALCHHHRRHLSKSASTRIGRWHEQFRRQKRNAKKRQKKEEEDEQSLQQPHGYPEEPYVLVDPLHVQAEPLVTIEGQESLAEGVVTMWDGSQTGPSPSYPPYPPQYQMPMRPVGYPPMEGFDPSMMMYPGQMHPMMLNHPSMMPRSAMNPNGYDVTQFPHGPPPAATNRVPGMTRPMQPYGMMPNYPMPYGYPYPAQVIRAGPPMPYGQLHPGGQQQVAAFPNPNAAYQMPIEPSLRNAEHENVALIKQNLMPIFNLRHGDESCSLPFEITPEIREELSRSDYELQLKCFKKDDKQMMSQWPINENGVQVKVTINGADVPIVNKNQSLLIKKYASGAENTLELKVNGCVCSHRFIMSLVHVQRVTDFLTTMIRESRKMVENPLEMSQRKLFHWARMTQMTTLPLADPRCRTRFGLPIRGKACMHPHALDLRLLLALYPDASFFECPYCRSTFAHNEIDVDHYLLQLIANTPDTVRDVVCCSDGHWRPMTEMPVQAPTTSRKRDNQGAKAGTMKRFKTESSLEAAKQSPMSRAPSSVPSSSTHPPSLPSMGHFIGQSPMMAMPHSVPDIKPDLMSPYHQSTSPTKMVVLPPSGPVAIGPLTPSTPGHPNTSTSPPQIIQTQSHGSVETSSLAGSAPYTPAPTSVGSSSLGHSVPGTSTANLDPQMAPLLHPLAPIDDFDQHLEGLFSTNDVMSAADLQRYLRDIDPGIGTRSKDSPPKTPTEEELSADLDDVVQIIAQDML